MKKPELIQHYCFQSRYSQGSPRCLAPGGKLIGFNGQFLAKSPKFCLKFFSTKIIIFLKIFAKTLLKSQRGDQRKHF
jgi:hypothetical protein